MNSKLDGMYPLNLKGNKAGVSHDHQTLSLSRNLLDVVLSRTVLKKVLHAAQFPGLPLSEVVFVRRSAIERQ